MKKILLLLSLTVSSLYSGKAQWVSIPDTNFGMWLNTNGYSACMQGNNSVGWQMDTSCPAVVNEDTVYCGYGGNIRDLTGISYFDGLQILDCRTNQLNSLPALPVGLLKLYCSDNQLSSLPALPAGLNHLYCPYNQLSSLPALPAGLNWLSCYDNQLSSLPALPPGLYRLFCYNNQLTSLPALPDSISYCYVYNNPLNCLPPLGKISYLDISNTNITCMPNRGNVTYLTPPVYLPLCDVFNANGCFPNLSISGNVHYDSNPNCLKDSNEMGIKIIPVQLLSNGILLEQTNTNPMGFYSFDADSLATYTIKIDTTGLPFYINCPLNGFHTSVLSSTDSLDYDLNFGLKCKPGFDLTAWSIEGRFRPGNVSYMDIHVGGLSNFYDVDCLTGAGVSGNVRVEISGPVNYVAPAPGALTPNNVSGNVLNYNVADFGTTDFNNSFNIIVQTDTSAALGSSVCFTVTVTPITGDDIPANNIQTHCFTVVGSFDPNDKQVYPAGAIDTAQEWLTYTIRFQNTGTAEAQHIYITDTLDSDLDVSSFQLLAYSHQPMVQLKENAVRFNFPNINLPDSNTSEPLSHGYVQYKVRIKDGKPIGTEINNTAYIYFDFNAPVVTNTATNTITNITAVSQIRNPQSAIRIFPNPAGNSVTFSIDETLIGAAATITDITGRKVAAVQLSTVNRQLSTIDFANGIYFVIIDTQKQRIAHKLTIAK